MSFQHPALLWFALLLLIPLILYLLPLPRRRVTASALYLWEQFLQADHFGRTSERFRRALGFALLAAILASLVLAAADLTIGRSNLPSSRIVVLVDPSASMSAMRDGVSNLSRARTAAADLIASAGGGAQVAIVDYPGELEVVSPFRAGGTEAARAVSKIEPFDGPVDLRKSLDEAYRLWGDSDQTHLYVFTDHPLPPNPWGDRAHAWVAPPAGDNIAVTELSARRRGKNVTVQYAVANFTGTARTIAVSVAVNGAPSDSVQLAIQPGQTARHASTFEQPEAARISVRLDRNQDALSADDVASAAVPALDDLRVAIVWPKANDRNEYVSAVLAALQNEGVVGPVGGAVAGAHATVYVNHVPPVWPAGGAIVLYPLRGGAIKIAGLHTQSLTVTRQAADPLMNGVDLRGFDARDAVQAAMPPWARPLAWADGLPVVWAGQTGPTKVLFVGIPVTPSGSRLPLVASFPVLMRNALQWMLPANFQIATATAEHRHDGPIAEGDSPLRISLLSAGESDLRRPDAVPSETFSRRYSLATAFVLIAACLLPVEWWLFHRRLTE